MVGCLLGNYPRAARKACPLCFFILMVGHRGYGLCRCFWASEIQREIETLHRRGKKPFSPTCSASRGRRRCIVQSKWHRFLVLSSFFLITVNETTSFCTKCVVSMKMAPKKSLFPNQSLIFYLFNQVLN